MSAINPGSHPKCASFYLQLCGILLAAVTLGLAYNHASPLGVRAPSAEEKANTVAALSIRKASRAISRTGYVNETLAMSLEPATTNLPTFQPTVPPDVAPTNNEIHFPELKWPQVKEFLQTKQIVLLDARLKSNYDSSHIPGAISLPANSPASDLQTFAMQYPKDTRFVVYCGSETCHMSRTLAENLTKLCGYNNVSEMPGGFSEYLVAESGAAKTPTP